MERKDAYIVYASDDRFAPILGVSMISLLENCRDMSGIVVYIMDGGISAENKEKLGNVCRVYKRQEPVFLPSPDISRRLNMEVTKDRGSMSQYARLLVSGCLPEHLDRVLYLDCDTMILRSLAGLWELDLEGKTVGALLDAFSSPYRINLGLKPGIPLFNSGVMLIDLNCWRERQVEERLLKFMSERHGRVQQGDQGVLNGVLAGDFKCIPPIFNSLTLFYDFSYQEIQVYRKPPYFYPEEAVRLAVSEPVVVHFTTSFLSRRPWVEGCKHRYREQWIFYKSLSPWSNMPLAPFQFRNLQEKLYVPVITRFPRKVLIGVSGILQAYGRPWVFWIKETLRKAGCLGRVISIHSQ